MSETKVRTLHYRRVAWLLNNDGKTIQHVMAEAHNDMVTTKDRTFSYARGEIQGLRHKEKAGVGVFLHISYYIPGQPTSIVPKPADEDEMEVGTATPPEQFDFMEGDVMVLASDDHLVFCSNGIHESVIQSYLEQCLQRIGHVNPGSAFSLGKVANVDKAKLLHDDGVKKLILGASLYDATVGHMERQAAPRTIKEKLVGSIRDTIIAIFAQDPDNELHDLHDKENLQVQLELRFDSRKKGGEIGRKRIEKTAGKLVDEEDEGFVIVTGSGKKLKPSEVILNTKKSINTMGNSVSYNDAWQKLEEYMAELRDNGMLAQ